MDIVDKNVQNINDDKYRLLNLEVNDLHYFIIEKMTKLISV
jgi:hypothetical protein